MPRDVVPPEPADLAGYADLLVEEPSVRLHRLDIPIFRIYLWVMRKAAPALLPIFRSQNQAALLAWLYLRPGEEFTLSELSRRLGVSPGALHAEVERLVTAGLLTDRIEGRNRLLQANTATRVARALTELLSITYGPQLVIAEEFSTIDGAEMVVIYGSWARRYAGEVGREPADIDVMVIGSPDRDTVYEAAERSEARLQMPVNPTVRSMIAWQEGVDPLVITAKRDALEVIGGDAGEGP
jgi:DNA-binding transcriptional ArsR family regulator